MNKTDIKSRINGLNDYMLYNTNKKLLLLNISSIYTYNKGIALIDKNEENTNWYNIDNKNCYKSWNEIEAFLDGLCLGKNTNFTEKAER